MDALPRPVIGLIASVGLLAAGCVQRTPDLTALPLVSPSAIPISTAIPVQPTEPLPLVTPTEECSERTGAFEIQEYRGVAVAQDVPVMVYLPPCYGAESRPYPTLYLLHGYPFDETHWQSLGAIERADGMIGREQWSPFIMVMPLQPEPLFRGSDGGPGSYETELLEGLVPFVEAKYRSDPSSRSLAGISRGGVWALEIAFRNPAEFRSVAALSPALAVNYPRPPYDPFEIVGKGEPLPRGILLVAGDEDWAAAETERLGLALTNAGIEHTFRIVAGDHSDTTWSAVLEQVLQFLAEGA